MPTTREQSRAHGRDDVALRVLQVVVQHADEEPAGTRDGWPAVGIPAELFHRGMLATVVLDGDAVLAIGKVQTRDEPSLVKKMPVQFRFGKSGAVKQKAEVRFAWGLAAGAGEVESRIEVGGAAST